MELCLRSGLHLKKSYVPSHLPVAVVRANLKLFGLIQRTTYTERRFIFTLQRVQLKTGINNELLGSTSPLQHMSRNFCLTTLCQVGKKIRLFTRSKKKKKPEIPEHVRTMREKKLQILRSAGYISGLEDSKFFEIGDRHIRNYVKAIPNAFSNKDRLYVSPALIVYYHENYGSSSATSKNKSSLTREERRLRLRLIVDSLQAKMPLRKEQRVLLNNIAVKVNSNLYLQKLDLLLRQGITLPDIRYGQHLNVFLLTKLQLERRIQTIKHMREVKKCLLYEMNCHTLCLTQHKFHVLQFKTLDMVFKASCMPDLDFVPRYVALAKRAGVDLTMKFIVTVEQLARLGFTGDEITEADPRIFRQDVPYYVLPLAIEEMRVQNVSGNLVSNDNAELFFSILREIASDRQYHQSRKKRILRHLKENESPLQGNESPPIEVSAKTAVANIHLLKSLGFAEDHFFGCPAILFYPTEEIQRGNEKLQEESLPKNILKDKHKLIQALTYEVEKFHEVKEHNSTSSGHVGKKKASEEQLTKIFDPEDDDHYSPVAEDHPDDPDWLQADDEDEEHNDDDEEHNEEDEEQIEERLTHFGEVGEHLYEDTSDGDRNK